VRRRTDGQPTGHGDTKRWPRVDHHDYGTYRPRGGIRVRGSPRSTRSDELRPTGRIAGTLLNPDEIR